MVPVQVLAAAAIAGVAANVSGYLITGRVFHRYQSNTRPRGGPSSPGGTIRTLPGSASLSVSGLQSFTALLGPRCLVAPAGF